MNKCRLILLFLLAGVLLCGCVATPENLKSDVETKQAEYTSTPVIVEEVPETSEAIDFSSLVKRGSLEVIRSQLDLDLKKIYDNITVRRARVGLGNAMPTYDIDIGGNPDYDLKEFANYFYADSLDAGSLGHYSELPVGSVIDSKRPATTEPTLDESTGHIFTINTYEYGIDKFVLGDDSTQSSYYYTTGNVWGSQTGSQHGNNDFYGFEKFKTDVRYDLDYDSIDDSSAYMMSDGKEWKISEAVNFVEDFWNTHLSPSDPMKFTYKVKTIWVLSTGENSFGYLFEMQRIDENGNYYDAESSNQYLFDDESQYIKDGESFVYTNEQMTWCAEKEEITRFIKDFSFSIGDITNSGDDLLSLGAAADILSNTLARRIGLDLTAELNYVSVCKGYPYYSIWEYPFYSDSTCITSCEFELRPMWCFRKEQCTLKMPYSAEIYFVDAVTGDVSMIIENKFKKAELGN